MLSDVHQSKLWRFRQGVSPARDSKLLPTTNRTWQPRPTTLEGVPTWPWRRPFGSVFKKIFLTIWIGDSGSHLLRSSFHLCLVPRTLLSDIAVHRSPLPPGPCDKPQGPFVLHHSCEIGIHERPKTLHAIGSPTCLQQIDRICGTTPAWTLCFRHFPCAEASQATDRTTSTLGPHSLCPEFSLRGTFIRGPVARLPEIDLDVVRATLKTDAVEPFPIVLVDDLLLVLAPPKLSSHHRWL